MDERPKELHDVRGVDGRFGKGNYTGRQFTSAMVKGNKFAKNNSLNKTSFKKGITTMTNHPNWRGGIQYNVKDCAYISTATNKRIRRPKFVWERAHGPIPSKYVIWHIDGNKHNDDIKISKL